MPRLVWYEKKPKKWWGAPKWRRAEMAPFAVRGKKWARQVLAWSREAFCLKSEQLFGQRVPRPSQNQVCSPRP